VGGVVGGGVAQVGREAAEYFEQPGALVVDDRAHRVGSVGAFGGGVEELAAAEAVCEGWTRRARP
jgi:hypothetical protein